MEVGDRQKVPRSLLAFKNLVYDDHGQAILTPLMKKGQLLDCNVVSFNNLNSAKREPTPDLTTLYFVEPCIDTYKKIAQDARQKMYDIMIVLFTKPVHDL